MPEKVPLTNKQAANLWDKLMRLPGKPPKEVILKIALEHECLSGRAVAELLTRDLTSGELLDLVLNWDKRLERDLMEQVGARFLTASPSKDELMKFACNWPTKVTDAQQNEAGKRLLSSELNNYDLQHLILRGSVRYELLQEAWERLCSNGVLSTDFLINTVKRHSELIGQAAFRQLMERDLSEAETVSIMMARPYYWEHTWGAVKGKLDKQTLCRLRRNSGHEFGTVIAHELIERFPQKHILMSIVTSGQNAAAMAAGKILLNRPLMNANLVAIMHCVVELREEAWQRLLKQGVTQADALKISKYVPSLRAAARAAVIPPTKKPLQAKRKPKIAPAPPPPPVPELTEAEKILRQLIGHK